MDAFTAVFEKCRPAFKQSRTYQRARSLALGVLSCVGRCTVTGMLSAQGNQFRDWTAAYRLFRGERMDMERIFGAIRRETIGLAPCGDKNIYAHMDDTLIRKKGRMIKGASWMRDPLGPPFATNFIWGQRFIQVSLSLFESALGGPSRAIPVDFNHCPVAKKPGSNAGAEQLKVFRELRARTKLSAVGAQRIAKLREDLDGDGYSQRRLILSVDGSYTNGTVIRALPENTTLIGRIRKDSKLYGLPAQGPKGAGRKRLYGDPLPTPEQIRQSDQYPYREVKAWAAGKARVFKVKVLKNIRWRKTGQRNMSLVIISPLGYRLTKKSRLFYRSPAYLICTDPDLETGTLLQAYIRRWEIEVGFRDQKTLLGCGKAQVRKKDPVEKIPAFVSATYAMILLAAHKTQSIHTTVLPGTKWYGNIKKPRMTTGDILNRLRAEKWAQSVRINFSDFVKLEKIHASRNNLANPFLSAIFYARK